MSTPRDRPSVGSAPAVRRARGLAAATALSIALLGLASFATAADPLVLWEIVHDQCVPNQERHHDPQPCVRVDLSKGVSRGFAVLKDINGATQFLLIPTRWIIGIESPLLERPGTPNYFAAAWRARRFTEAVVGHPMARDTLSLALNSAFGRSQDQLHIHIDCVRADVRAALRRQRFQIARHWAPLPVLLAGHRYRALRIDGATLAGHDPIKLLAWSLPRARIEMDRYTLVVVGMQYGRVPGFAVLETRAEPRDGNRGTGEELQDHACALSR